MSSNEQPKHELADESMLTAPVAPPSQLEPFAEGGWAVCCTGAKLHYRNPQAAEISIHDIAAGLSRVCRFSGQLAGNIFYSVAEHCTLGASYARIFLKSSPRIQLLFLIHDGTEAYMQDMPRGLKLELPQYAEMENRLMGVIYQALHIKPPTIIESKIIKDIDNVMVLAERAKLLTDAQRLSWPVDAPAIDCDFECLGPAQAKSNFMRAYNMLTSEGAFNAK